jgi:hypothetical protein
MYLSMSPDGRTHISSSGYKITNRSVLCVWISDVSGPSIFHARSCFWCYIEIVHDCGLVVRVPGYTSEMYCVSCEVRTEVICYVEESRPPLWSSGQSSWATERRCILFPVRYELNLYMLCRRK